MHANRSFQTNQKIKRGGNLCLLAEQQAYQREWNARSRGGDCLRPVPPKGKRLNGLHFPSATLKTLW